MDLIYTDVDRKDVGVLKDFAFDLAFGSDENDFEISLDRNNHCCKANCLVYIEGTEYGGIIDKVNVITKEDKLTYKGRTWHGMLASKVIEPDKGSAYLTVSGDAHKVIGDIIARIGLSDLFTVSEEFSGLAINNYSFDRYTDAYLGLRKMLASVSGKLKLTFKDDKVILSALPIVDYSKDEQFDVDQVELEVEKTFNSTNHMICLGSGELVSRQVVHLYVDANGKISETQTFTGLQEVTDVYDYPNAESLDELKKGGRERLREQTNGDKMQLNFVSEEIVCDIGDIVGITEVVTDTNASATITKKIVTISQGTVNIQYKVGE